LANVVLQVGNLVLLGLLAAFCVHNASSSAIIIANMFKKNTRLDLHAHEADIARNDAREFAQKMQRIVNRMVSQSLESKSDQLARGSSPVNSYQQGSL
jgi:hypothetical protein